ncbi:MAG: 30S ribosomal protein S20 [Candidatus Dormibacteraeota bacterium]|nr:30S ribosomal protein S20 [Candidatus Dormibacteraeota bacterium]
MAKRTASAKKQARAGVRRALRNRAVRSEVKTKVVKARRTLTGGPVAESDRYAIALEAIQALDRAASKGILHRNNAGRRKARLAKQLSKLAVSAGGGAGSATAAAAGKAKKASAAAPKAVAKSAAPSSSSKKK